MKNPASLALYDKPERERGKRVRPAAKLAQLRATVAALEHTLPVMLTLDSADDVDWTGFLNPTTLRLRRQMLDTLQLTKQAQQLVTEQYRLKRLLHEHRVASRVLAGMVSHATPENDWEVCTEKWRELARRHFKPWTLEECQEGMQAALQEMNAFQWSTDKQTTGVSFLGWRETRRVDPTRSKLQFEFYKTFHGQDLESYIQRSWDIYTDSRLFPKIIVGPRTRSFHTVLQRLGSNAVIVLGSERSPSVDVDVHMLFLVFLDQTESEAKLGVRSIISPELMKAIDTPTDVWASSFVWLQWDLPPGMATQAFNVRLGGTIGSIDPAYVNQWMSEVFGSLLRSERHCTGRNLLTSD